MLDTHSFLVCLYGGIITPETDGQEYEDKQEEGPGKPEKEEPLDKELLPELTESPETESMTEEEKKEYVKQVCQYIDQYAKELQEEELERLKENLINVLESMEYIPVKGKWGEGEEVQAYESGFELTRRQAMASLVEYMKELEDPYAVMSLGRAGLLLKTGEVEFELSNEYAVGIAAESVAALEERMEQLEFVAGFVPAVGPAMQFLMFLAEEDYEDAAQNAVENGVIFCLEQVGKSNAAKRAGRAFTMQSFLKLIQKEYTTTDMQIRVEYKQPFKEGANQEQDGGDIDMAYHAKEYRVSKENEVEEQETYFEGAISSAGNPVTLTMNIWIKGVTQGNQTQKFYEDGSTGGVLE